MPDRYFLITHSDLDGTGAEIVARRLYDNPIVYRSEANSECVDEQVRRAMLERRSDMGGTIVVVDLCPSGDVLKEMDDEGNVFLYDHHVTAAGPCYKYPWAVVDQSRAGTRLLCEEESKRIGRPVTADMTAFVQAVDAYDRWQLSSPHRLAGENLNYLHRFIWWGRMVRRGAKVELDDRERWLVECFRENIARDAERVIKVAKEGIDEDGHRFVAAIADVGISDVANAVTQAYPDAEYLLLVNPMSGGVALRTPGGSKFDVSALAKKRGGGGHHEAAGYPFNLDVLKLVGGRPA